MNMEEQIRENQKILRMLRRPEGQIDVVLDTDTYNEIDDQYALAFLVKSAPRLRHRGLFLPGAAAGHPVGRLAGALAGGGGLAVGRLRGQSPGSITG